MDKRTELSLYFILSLEQASEASKNRVACDIEYLENWNLTLECGIIARTVAQLIVPPPSAY